MTRDEAVRKVADASPGGKVWPEFTVDSLVALGLLHLETTEDKVRVAAAERLTWAHTLVIGPDGGEVARKITRDGAFEIIDVLTKSGFRITKDG